MSACTTEEILVGCPDSLDDEVEKIFTAAIELPLPIQGEEGTADTAGAEAGVDERLQPRSAEAS